MSARGDKIPRLRASAGSIVKRLPLGLILLVIALGAFVSLYQVKLVITPFCNPRCVDHRFEMSRVPFPVVWATQASAEYYGIPSVLPSYDEVEVSYDVAASFCSPGNAIPLRLHLKNMFWRQGMLFGMGFFVESPTGLMIGSFRYEIRLELGEGFDAALTYFVPPEWQGYDLRIHPIVWEGAKTVIVYYRPFLAWTFPSLATIFQSGQTLVRFGFYLVTFALLPASIGSEWTKQLWEKLGRLRKGLAVILLFMGYMVFWSLLMAVQYAHP